MTDIKGQPDKWFQVDTDAANSKDKNMRLDAVGLSLTHDFLSAVEDLDQEGPSGFQGFGEDIFRHDYFRNFEEISVRLGLEEQYKQIFSRLQPILTLVTQLTSGPTSRNPNIEDVDKITKGYRSFLQEVANLFKKFQESHAKI